MALLNDCSSNYYVTLPACIDLFTIAGLSPDTIYHYFIEDKFEHIYHEEVVTDADGVMQVLASDFPDGFFNPYIGQLKMDLMEGIGYCEPIEIAVCGAVFNRIVISFKHGNFSNQINIQGTSAGSVSCCNNYSIEFTVGESGMIDGQAVYQSDLIKNKMDVKIFREGLLQSSSGSNNAVYNSVAGTVIFTPAVNNGERIVIVEI